MRIPEPTSDEVASMTIDRFKDWVMGRDWRSAPPPPNATDSIGVRFPDHRDREIGHRVVKKGPHNTYVWEVNEPEPGDILNGVVVR